MLVEYERMNLAIQRKTSYPALGGSRALGRQQLTWKPVTCLSDVVASSLRGGLHEFVPVCTYHVCSPQEDQFTRELCSCLTTGLPLTNLSVLTFSNASTSIGRAQQRSNCWSIGASRYLLICHSQSGVRDCLAPVSCHRFLTSDDSPTSPSLMLLFYHLCCCATVLDPRDVPKQLCRSFRIFWSLLFADCCIGLATQVCLAVWRSGGSSQPYANERSTFGSESRMVSSPHLACLVVEWLACLPCQHTGGSCPDAMAGISPPSTFSTWEHVICCLHLSCVRTLNSLALGSHYFVQATSWV